MTKIAIRALACLAMLAPLATSGGALAAVATQPACAERQESTAAPAHCEAGDRMASAPGEGQGIRQPAASPEATPKAQPQPPLPATHPCGDDRRGAENHPPAF